MHLINIHKSRAIKVLNCVKVSVIAISLPLRISSKMQNFQISTFQRNLLFQYFIFLHSHKLYNTIVAKLHNNDSIPYKNRKELVILDVYFERVRTLDWKLFWTLKYTLNSFLYSWDLFNLDRVILTSSVESF